MTSTKRRPRAPVVRAAAGSATRGPRASKPSAQRRGDDGTSGVRISKEEAGVLFRRPDGTPQDPYELSPAELLEAAARALRSEVCAFWFERPVHQPTARDAMYFVDMPATRAWFPPDAPGGVSPAVFILFLQAMKATARVAASESDVPSPVRSKGDAVTIELPPTSGAYWMLPVLKLGPAAVLEAAARLLEIPDLSTQPNNVLSTIADIAGATLKRALLLETLRVANWNMAHAAEMLSMGKTAQPILREIKRLGLEPEYNDAKRRGLIHKRGHRQREPSVVSTPALRVK